MGTLQHSTLVLQTPLVLVLGHSSCGAVYAAAAMKWYGVSQSQRIGRLLECVTPGLPQRDPAVSTEPQINAAVEANVRWSMQLLLQTRKRGRTSASTASSPVVTPSRAARRASAGDGYNINFGVQVNVTPMISSRADRFLREHEHAVRSRSQCVLRTRLPQHPVPASNQALR